jgi:hypothetical protein
MQGFLPQPAQLERLYVTQIPDLGRSCAISHSRKAHKKQQLQMFFLYPFRMPLWYSPYLFFWSQWRERL